MKSYVARLQSLRLQPLGKAIGDTPGSYGIFSYGKASYTQDLHQCIGVVIKGRENYALCHCLQHYDNDCLNDVLNYFKDEIKAGVATAEIYTIEWGEHPQKTSMEWQARNNFGYIEDTLFGSGIPSPSIQRHAVPYENKQGHVLQVDKHGYAYRYQPEKLKEKSQGCCIS